LVYIIFGFLCSLGHSLILSLDCFGFVCVFVCEVVYFGVSLGILCTDDWVYNFVLLIWARCPSLGVVGNGVMPGLVYSWRPS